jgi:phage baseplate assembly protein W
MTSYIGFSTINTNKPRFSDQNEARNGGPGGIKTPILVGKKYRLTDEQLVIQDFLNALNIPQGQKVGNPGYGTTLWSFVFEPNTADVQYQLETEIRRVASQDPRLIVNLVKAFPQESGILIEVELAIAPFNNAQVMSVFFNNATSTAVIQ